MWGLEEHVEQKGTLFRLQVWNDGSCGCGCSDEAFIAVVRYCKASRWLPQSLPRAEHLMTEAVPIAGQAPTPRSTRRDPQRSRAARSHGACNLQLWECLGTWWVLGRPRWPWQRQWQRQLQQLELHRLQQRSQEQRLQRQQLQHRPFGLQWSLGLQCLQLSQQLRYISAVRMWDPGLHGRSEPIRRPCLQGAPRVSEGATACHLPFLPKAWGLQRPCFQRHPAVWHTCCRQEFRSYKLSGRDQGAGARPASEYCYTHWICLSGFLGLRAGQRRFESPTVLGLRAPLAGPLADCPRHQQRPCIPARVSPQGFPPRHQARQCSARFPRYC